MPTIDHIIRSNVELSTRAKQVCGMFDVPIDKKNELHWQINAPIENKEWNIGLIVGPSGSGKSTIGKHLYPDLIDKKLEWNGYCVIDDFDSSFSLEEITKACSSVGFNTIPAWLRPYEVLSNGEKFRVEMARRILEDEDLIVVDEFTSVVDRQVAQIGSHAIQKYIRKTGKKFIALSCHYDIIDWLQPDWIIDPASQSFNWRSLRQRPKVECEIRRVEYCEWKKFSKYHYLTADLNKAARCFGLFINNQICAFTGIIHRPHAKTGGWKACSRLVTLPDWQGLGLAFALIDTVGSAYWSLGWKFRCYPAHPSFIRSYKKSKVWKNCGQSILTKQRSIRKDWKNVEAWTKHYRQTTRSPFVFEYRGPKMNKEQAKLFVGG